ncbi:hypothetical protein JMUB7518_28110 [Staphylococcus aureus]
MYKRQEVEWQTYPGSTGEFNGTVPLACLLYTSDAADELDGVDLGGRRIIKKHI